MWRSDVYPTEVHQRLSVLAESLPVYVEPAADEAMASWFYRLAVMLDLSPLNFIRQAFGIDSRRDVEWWRRPHKDQIAVIGNKTGLESEHVASMTMRDWFSARDDERQGRFSAQRVLRRPARRAAERSMVVCPCCLRDDDKPYIRRHWMIGWLAVCPRHQCVLVSDCPSCSLDLRVGNLGGRERIVIGRCDYCGFTFDGASARPALATVTALQEQLLELKRDGIGTLAPLGPIDWPIFTTLADVIMSAIWVDTSDHAREALFARIIRDLGMKPDQRLRIKWPANYGTLLILTWMFADWPNRLEQTLRDLQSLSIESILDRLPDLGSELRKQSLDLLSSARDYRRCEAGAERWRDWLNGLVDAGVDFRAMARKELDQGYNVRLTVLAMLAEGSGIADAAAWARLQHATVARWLDIGSTYGLHAIIAKPLRRNELTPDQLRDMEEWLAFAGRSSSPKTGWKPDHARNEIAARFGVLISSATAQSLLPKARMRSAVSRS
ncbi:MAG: TniQ family protein [Pseudomonadota bacterium]